MLVWLERLLFGLCEFTRRAFSGVWKRALILTVGILVGFAGPVIALPDLPALHGDEGWFWDAFAIEANNHHEYKDVILAVIPAAFICFTDFMNHVLDEEYRYADSALFYNGIFTILSFLIGSVLLLQVSYADFASGAKTSWLASFHYSWSLARLVLVGAFVFEIALACAEALRQVRKVFAERVVVAAHAAQLPGTGGEGRTGP